MLRTVSDVGTVAHAIQLSVAPVFLLSGIGALLSVMTNRLARVIDRARLLENRFDASESLDIRNIIKKDLENLSLRAKLINWSINLCSVAALLVCSVIALLFVGALLSNDPSYTVAALFIAAMLCMVTGLLFFLREIFLATAILRIGPGSQSTPSTRS